MSAPSPSSSCASAFCERPAINSYTCACTVSRCLCESCKKGLLAAADSTGVKCPHCRSVILTFTQSTAAMLALRKEPQHPEDSYLHQWDMDYVAGIRGTLENGQVKIEYKAVWKNKTAGPAEFEWMPVTQMRGDGMIEQFHNRYNIERPDTPSFVLPYLWELDVLPELVVADDGVKCYKCPEAGCSSKHAKKMNVLSHIFSKHLKRAAPRHRCELCLRTFAKKDALLKHTKKIHV